MKKGKGEETDKTRDLTNCKKNYKKSNQNPTTKVMEAMRPRTRSADGAKNEGGHGITNNE